MRTASLLQLEMSTLPEPSTDTPLGPATLASGAGPPSPVSPAVPVPASVVMMLVGVTARMMGKVTAPDVPPPGVGLNTVIEAVPVAVMSAARMAAVNCVPLTNVVVRSVPFQRTTDPPAKPEPFTVSVNAAPPTTAPGGLVLASTGTGLLVVNVAPDETPPPGAGLNTVTVAVPPAAMSEARIAAVNCAPVTKVVERSAPFQRTMAPETKLDPFTVSVKPAPPAKPVVGAIELSTGTGLPAPPVMVKV